LIFTGFRGQSPEETRREGSSLLLKCPYTAQQGQQQLLSWGRVIGDHFQVLAEAWSALNSPTKEVTAGRVVLWVDSSSRTATITMANLQAEDSGTYCCTLRSSHYSKHLPLKSISLNVYKEVHKWELDTLSEQCRYRDLRHSTATRVWCRRGPSGCHIWLRTNSTWANSRGLEGRVLMQDDTQKGTVTVTMMKLQARDAGTYWCALQRNWQLVRVMEIRLFVSKSKYPLQPAVVPPAASCGTPCSQLWYPLQSAVVPPAVSCGTPCRQLWYPLQPAVVPPAASCGTPCSQLWYPLQPAAFSNPNSSVILSVSAFCSQVESTERKESPKNDSKDLKYATLNFEAQLSPEDALYCNIEPSQAHRRPRDDDVQYAIIGLQ
ncbi:CLM9 protein, partial [Ramphastos sulfuratus]|nr:CLM9 protein [Ramphastos sulfuratus]